MEDIYSILDVIERPGGKVLATIIDIKGSAYKKEGSAMVFLADGSPNGLLSAGCLEYDLGLKAEEVLQKEATAVVQYDMSDETDFGWGQGAGCNGTITILLEWVDKRLEADLLTLKRLLQANIPVLAFKNISAPGEYLFLPKEGEPFGRWKEEIPDVCYKKKSGLIQERMIFRHVFQPKPRLILFGAGPDARPLARIAAQTGFTVFVCDWREEYCRRDHFPEADRLILGFPREIFELINFTEMDFVVIMSHHFQRDQEILASLPIGKLQYVGVLGPRERTRRLLFNQKIPEKLHTPAGLSIGADGPEEIAVSILGEIVEARRKSGILKVEG